jgi:hypothetical protein
VRSHTRPENDEIGRQPAAAVEFDVLGCDGGGDLLKMEGNPVVRMQGLHQDP